MTDTTTRYLLLELDFDAAIDPDASPTMTADTSPLGVIAEGIGHFIDGESALVDLGYVGQVYPGDIVAPHAAVQPGDIWVALRDAAGYATRARAALDDEHEGDFKANLAALLDVAVRLNAFAEAM